MSLPAELKVALKEWKVLTDALATGRQMLLLRKGGIYDHDGEFTLEHRQFIFFPTYLHQDLRMLKPDAQAGFEARSAEPAIVKLAVAGEVTDIIKVKSRQQFDRLDAEHIWTPPLIDMRFSYRPDNPLYLLLVRAYQLPEEVAVENTPAYAGCKSWVPLEAPIATTGAEPAIPDDAYGQRRQQILNVFSE